MADAEADAIRRAARGPGADSEAPLGQCPLNLREVRHVTVEPTSEIQAGSATKILNTMMS